ncbi:MAG: hypothetical protein ACYS7Y_25670 [Planctomycetota bacterium]
MARNRRKKALYEVISEARSRGFYGGAGEQAPEKKVEEDEAAPVQPAASAWPRKPRVLQYSAGRIEISLPYQLAIAVVLGIVLLVLASYRLGQRMSYPGELGSANLSSGTEAVGDEGGLESGTGSYRPIAGAGEGAGEVASVGNNRIVIQTYRLRTHLEPVKRYFESPDIGIETEIRKIGEWYYLVTKDKYENPNTKGTAGYKAKQKIIEAGARYKAPPGYESFGDKPFYDAYAMKFDD